MGLLGELKKIESLNAVDKNSMFNLMNMYYENVKAEYFDKDLREKDYALLLKDEDSLIQGFTTIKTYDIRVDGIPVRLVFSGDTIISREHWGDLELHRTWIRVVNSLVKEHRGKSYWLLISKGYKTYRFLPVYFYSFYPCCSEQTPEFERKVIDAFCEFKYPDVYDAEKGVLCFKGEKDYLKKGIADITEKQLKNPHVSFFVKKNPGYICGDELVCLTEITPENMKSMVLRYIEG